MHGLKQKVVTFAHEKLVEPTKRLTSKEIAVAVVVGFLTGVFPVPFTATIVAFLLASCLRFSAPQFALCTGVNFLCTPLQFLLIPLFARGCAMFTGHSATDFTVSALRASLSKGGLAAVKSCGLMLAYALVTWCMLTAPILFVCHSIQRRAHSDKNS